MCVIDWLFVSLWLEFSRSLRLSKIHFYCLAVIQVPREVNCDFYNCKIFWFSRFHLRGVNLDQGPGRGPGLIWADGLHVADLIFSVWQRSENVTRSGVLGWELEQFSLTW